MFKLQNPNFMTRLVKKKSIYKLMSTKKWACSCIKPMTNKSVSFEGGTVFFVVCIH